MPKIFLGGNFKDMSRLQSYWIIIICITFIQCEEQIDFDIQSGVEEYVWIEGQIDPLGVQVQLRRINERRRFIAPITDICVELVLPDNEKIELSHEADGVFITSKDFRPEYETDYFLEVTLENGDLLQSFASQIPQGNVTDTLFLSQSQRFETSEFGTDIATDVIEGSLVSDLSNTEPNSFHYWWVEETYIFRPTDVPYPIDWTGLTPPPCFINVNLGTRPILILNRSEVLEDEYRVESVFERDLDKSFLEKHLFTIYHQIIDPNYYEYLRRVRSLLESNGSLFDLPPARIQSNFVGSDGLSVQNVVGYFAAVNQYETKIVIRPSQLNINPSVVEDCDWDSFGDVREIPDVCWNCTLIPGATRDRPPFWDQL